MSKPSYFDNANEFSLYSAIQKADEAVQPMAAARQYNEALARLASLREPVDAFFEAVMVNAEDAERAGKPLRPAGAPARSVPRRCRYFAAGLRGLLLKLLILDRDGVINYDSDAYIKSVEEWIPLPGAIEAIAQLSKAGWTVAVATNQSGIARGYYDIATLEAMHARLRALVAEQGGEVGLMVYCPHGPDEGCDCRKPKPGMLKTIAEHYKVPIWLNAMVRRRQPG